MKNLSTGFSAQEMVVLWIKKQFLLLLNGFLVVAEFGLGLLRDRLLILAILVYLE
ncbi:hypothetical protein [Fischerella thermalis]|uniref:hypothetical protein n=1 Tax=Fischerella thermalis TaxID=372787 RepID=UPI0015E0DFD3|nr:hypothetical protein [Fischerella thermalis]